MRFRRWWKEWRKPQEPVKVVCARVGESLAPPEGSVVRACDRCQSEITVAPLTLTKLRHIPARFHCIQCVAAEDPTAPLGPMSMEDVLQFVEARGAFPLPIFRTVGEMNTYMDTLFPDRRA